MGSSRNLSLQIFDRATFAFRRKHASFTYFVFVTVTWLSIVHSVKTIHYVSLYPEKERRFGKSGNLCTQRSKLASRTCGRAQATFQHLYWLLQKQYRRQQTWFMNRSHLMRSHLLVHHHLSCLLVRSRLITPRLLSRTLPPFLRPRNSELESKLVSLDDIINRCDYYVFFELNKRSFNKILNAENTEPVI